MRDVFSFSRTSSLWNQIWKRTIFFVFSRVLRDSTPRFVGPSVGPSVRPSVPPSHFTFFGFLWSLASLLLPKWSSDLKYGPCPLAREWCCRVSGPVFIRSTTKAFVRRLVPAAHCLSSILVSISGNRQKTRSWLSRCTKIREDKRQFRSQLPRHDQTASPRKKLSKWRRKPRWL